MDRPKRSARPVNYWKMHNGQEELDFVDDGLHQDDLDEMMDSSEGEASEQGEDGEIVEVDNWKGKTEDVWLNMTEREFEGEFQNAGEVGDVEKMEFLLEMKDKRCNMLRQEVEKENGYKEKQKKVRQLQDKFNKLKRTEADLSRSLANSRSSTPLNTPGKASRGKPTVKSVIKKPDRKRTISTKRKLHSAAVSPRPQEQAGDLNRGEDLLHYLTGLDTKSNSRSREFNELLAAALQASNNFKQLADNKHQSRRRLDWQQDVQFDHDQLIDKLKKLDSHDLSVKGGQASLDLEFKREKGYATNNSECKDNSKSNNSTINNRESVNAEGGAIHANCININSPEGREQLAKFISELKISDNGGVSQLITGRRIKIKN